MQKKRQNIANVKTKYTIKSRPISINFGKKGETIIIMPKKLGINPKAAEARERKATQKKTTQEQAAKVAEDALWKDDDKNATRKKTRKEEEDRKKAELLKKKAENKALLEQEMLSLKTAPKQSIQKVTQIQIQQEVERRNKVIDTINKPTTVTVSLITFSSNSYI